MKPIRLIAGFLTVGLWTLVSRVMGFVRDILIAAYLGSGPVAEAFLVAFSLPNMFRRFFAEGAFNTAFVPLYSKKFEAGEDARGFASDAFAGLAFVLAVLSVVAVIFMPALVLAMAGGFAGDVRFGIAVDFGRIAFVYILFISLAALVSGVLNATGRFAAAAAAPVLLNLILVLALVLADAGAPGGAGGLQGLVHGWYLSVAVVVAGVAQLALVWVAAARAGLAPVLRRPRWTPEMRRLAIIAAPAMLAGGVVQINLLVGRQVGSFFDGAIAWLSFADRLYQLPLGVVGIAIGVVLLPDLSRRLKARDDAGGRDAFSRATEFGMMLTVPAAVALVAIPVPLVSVLFGRGAFGEADIAATALAVAVYGLGLPAFVLQKVLQPLYFARENTRSPFRFALVAMVVNLVVAVTGAWAFGFIGAALGTTVASWAMVWQLARGARGMGEVATLDARAWRRLPRIAVASGVMGGLLWVAAWALAGPLAAGGVRYLALLALVVGGMAVYFGAGHLLGAFRLSEFRRALRR